MVSDLFVVNRQLQQMAGKMCNIKSSCVAQGIPFRLSSCSPTTVVTTTTVRNLAVPSHTVFLSAMVKTTHKQGF